MSRVYRCFTEKKPGFDVEAQGVLRDLRGNLGVRSIDSLRLFSRYDVEGVSGEVYSQARGIVFSEPQVDECYDEALPVFSGDHRILAVEALPGQYDQRADSCAQCIQMLLGGERPTVQLVGVKKGGNGRAFGKSIRFLRVTDGRGYGKAPRLSHQPGRVVRSKTR